MKKKIHFLWFGVCWLSVISFCAAMTCKPRGYSHLFQLSNLFRYAHGDVRCVKLPQPRDDFYYCISDVVRCVCEVGAERATEIWKTLPDKMKQELQGGVGGGI